MIYYIKGNLLESEAQALVNTVNTVGVMGKGIALQFREAFPKNYRIYRNLCKQKGLHIGEMLITEETNSLNEQKIIVNFPTKTNWRYPSEYEYISKGLIALRKEIETRKIKSIAIPPLGSHNGGLEWSKVREMIECSLKNIDCDIYLYEPSDAIVEQMKSERVKLTPARAMLLVMFNDMVRHGEFVSVFAAEKLIYFMQKFEGYQYFKIDFKPYIYGPYSGGKVAHVLYHMNGSYITGMTGMQNRPFDYIWLTDDAVTEAMSFIRNYEGADLMGICNRTMDFLHSHYSNYSLELLSSVDYILTHTPTLNNWRKMDDNSVLNAVANQMHEWSARKERIFKHEFLEKALQYLRTSAIYH